MITVKHHNDDRFTLFQIYKSIVKQNTQVYSLCIQADLIDNFLQTNNNMTQNSKDEHHLLKFQIQIHKKKRWESKCCRISFFSTS
jgi:hypothetical protein